MSPSEPVQEYFSIGEVCQLTGLRPHVLRYWESQFAFLKPTKNRSGNRVYQRREVEVIMLVKHLLHSERYTIEGAKQKVDEHRKSADLRVMARGALNVETLVMLEDELSGLLDELGPADGDSTVGPESGAIRSSSTGSS